jgi:cytosine/adenosine deaminase-related metal-dependent hydrolase
MVLSGVKLVDGEGVFSIGIEGTQISFVSGSPFAEFDDRLQLSFQNALAFPGLINSHDHLDFNLFPQLGYKSYSNYVDWGEHIHQHYKAEIDKVLSIPVALRAKWGVYKNLICGVTTVVDHGLKHDTGEPLLTIHSNCQSLHSVRLEKNWKSRLNNPMRLSTPAVIHIGEGTDEASHHEIDELIRWNILQRELVGIHGVAMSPEQAKHFKALVWCPQTNYFLLNKTAPVNQLKNNTTVLFGTDSTLTGNWDIWDHMRMARKTALLTDEELYRSVTINAANIWKLNSGRLTEGNNADVVVVKQTGNGLDSFFNVKPEDILLVIHEGNIRLFDEELLPQLTRINNDAFSKFEINGSHKYIQGDLPALIDQIQHYHPEAAIPVRTNQPLTV